MIRNDIDLFFTCSLIEYIGRQCKLQRKQAAEYLGKEYLKRIYKFAGTLHCEPIGKVADDYIQMRKIPVGNFDNVKTCKYEVPDYWTIGEVYGRLIEDAKEDDSIEMLVEVYNSWISEALSNFNSDFYYQSREYIYECYRQGKIL